MLWSFQIQNQSHSSEGALSSLEEALTDRDKQINQLREQRDRAEKDTKEEKELHERELAEYKMKIHTYDSEVSSIICNNVTLHKPDTWKSFIVKLLRKKLLNSHFRK